VDDLVKFLSDRLAHEEAHAKKDLWAAEKATPGRWRARYGTNLDHSWVETESTPVLRLDSAQHEADALLSARFQPETVKQRANAKLTDVEAKRRLLSEFTHYKPGDSGYPEVWMAVRLAALPYADHPDYRDEWKP
jgi:hypothetical protein